MNKLEELVIECDESIIFYTRHLERMRKQISLIEKSKRVIKNCNSNADLAEFIEIENLNNYNGYLTISTLDLAVNLKNLISAKTDWEKIFFIKNSYLLIHETLNKLKPPQNKNFLEKSIKESYKSLVEEFEELMQEIICFKNTSEYKKIKRSDITLRDILSIA
ncbi:hypothetical protein [Flavimarina sp. Hel_I_48]|uniref:hypothetical protein n=1 Tax=Flavimarina sp. Hel_I_48 TaxID=1392488 RepID=UPI0004DEFF1D|nr:hypothetical protein [Flavimarina sp. Hel_I_48]